MQVTETPAIRLATRITRPVTALIGMSVLCCSMIVTYFCDEAAFLEFRASVANRDKPRGETPSDVACYRDKCSWGWNDNHQHPKMGVAAFQRDGWPWGWSGPIAGAAVLFILLCRRTCTVLEVISYGAVMIVFTVWWLCNTLFVFYVANQVFWV